MIRQLTRISSLLDSRGQFDLADRLDSMTRLAAPIMDLYHGTRDHSISPDELEPRDPVYDGSIGEGVYFGEQPETAQFYAGPAGRIIHRRMDIRNPLVIDGSEYINYRIAPEHLDDVENGAFDSIIPGERIPPFDALIGGEWCEIRDGWDLSNIGHWATNAGHDAVILRNVRWTNGPNEEVLVLPHHPELARTSSTHHDPMTRSGMSRVVVSRMGRSHRPRTAAMITDDLNGWIDPTGTFHPFDPKRITHEDWITRNRDILNELGHGHVSSTRDAISQGWTRKNMGDYEMGTTNWRHHLRSIGYDIATAIESNPYYLDSIGDVPITIDIQNDDQNAISHGMPRMTWVQFTPNEMIEAGGIENLLSGRIARAISRITSPLTASDTTRWTRLASFGPGHSNNAGWIAPSGRYVPIGKMEHSRWIDQNRHDDPELSQLGDDQPVDDKSIIGHGWTRHSGFNYEISTDRWQDQIHRIQRHISQVIDRFPYLVESPGTTFNIEVGTAGRDIFRFGMVHFTLGELMEVGDLMSLIGPRVATVVARLTAPMTSATTSHPWTRLASSDRIPIPGGLGTIVGPVMTGHSGRNVIVVELPDGSRQAFYRSSGRNSGRPDTWFPFDGVSTLHGNLWFDKRRFVDQDADPRYANPLHRFGTRQMRDISDALANMDLQPTLDWSDDEIAAVAPRHDNSTYDWDDWNRAILLNRAIGGEHATRNIEDLAAWRDRHSKLPRR